MRAARHGCTNSKFLIINSSGTQVARGPVARAQMLDAHHPRRTRRVHELIAADRDRDVRRTRIGGREEQDVAGREILSRDRFPHPILFADLARQRQPVLREDVLREAAAVEAAGSVPPFRYGAPRNESAVPTSA